MKKKRAGRRSTNGLPLYPFSFIWETEMKRNIMEIQIKTFLLSDSNGPENPTLFLPVHLLSKNDLGITPEMFLSEDRFDTQSQSLECLFSLWFVEVHQLS